MATTTVSLNRRQRYAIISKLIGTRDKTGSALEAIATKAARDALGEDSLKEAIEGATKDLTGDDAIRAELAFVATFDTGEDREEFSMGPIEIEHVRTFLGKMDAAGDVPTNLWAGIWQVVFEEFEAGPYAKTAVN